MIGVLKIRYASAAFSKYLPTDDETASYLYQAEDLIAIVNALPSQASVMDTSISRTISDLLHSSEPVEVRIFKKYAITKLELDASGFQIIQVTPISSILDYSGLISYLILSILLLCLSSFAIIRIVFRPFQIITRFSEHIQQINSAKLSTFPDAVPTNELGTLIENYNEMVNRTNQLSEDLVNQEVQLRNAQIEALQSQLNPHFFYGTLESIRMIAQANHQPLIAEITFAFSKLMRYSLSREYLVPVNAEIEIVRQYLQIQEKRLAGRYAVQWEVSEFSEKLRCPKFILFSLVENAFSHSISRTRTLVHLVIRVLKTEDHLIIQVENDGPGFSEERLSEVLDYMHHPGKRIHMESSSNGRSLFNIYDRLGIFYGTEAEFVISSVDGEHTCCQIKIPLKVSALD